MFRTLNPERYIAIMSINPSLVIIGNAPPFYGEVTISQSPGWYTFHSHFWYTIAFPLTLVITRANNLLALDAKINFDDDGLYRHAELKGLRDFAEEDPLEVEAVNNRVNYIKLDGDVGCMVNGAGLAMTTMDLIKLAGGEPANFLDVGGGASAEQIENAFRILTSDPKVRVILVNIFGGILRCDRVATGLIEAVKKTNIAIPMVVRLQGTNLEEGRRLLEESDLTFQVAHELYEAAAMAVALGRRQG